MATLGFFHNVYDNLAATEFAIKSVREHYPDAFYILLGDGGSDHYDLAETYNCHYIHYPKNIGYPVDSYGFSTEQSMSWLKRMVTACALTDTTHLMMMEDDVVVLDKIDINEQHCIGQPIGVHNKIHPSLLKFAEDVSGVKPKTDYYFFGGGSILRVDTVMRNFDRVASLLFANMDEMKKVYPQIGWLDCFMTYFFYLSGESVDLHSNFYTVAPWPQDNRDFDLNTIRGQYAIVDRYKNNYK